MSKLKRKSDEYYDFAFNEMKRIGAISVCEICLNYYYWTDEFEKKDVYAILTNKLKEKYGDKQDFKLFQQQIDIIITDAAYDIACPFCYKD